MNLWSDEVVLVQKDTLKELCRLMNIDEIEIERGGERGEKERDIYL